MAVTAFLHEYILWHYTKALSEFFELFGNFAWFLYHFFSIGILLKTLISPIWRVQEKYRSGFDPGAFFESLFVNFISRTAGLFVRSILILAGLFAELLLILLVIPAFLIWLFLPLVVPLLFFAGLSMLVL